MRSITLPTRALALAGAVAISGGAIAASASSAKPRSARSAGATIHVIEHAVTDVEQPGAGGKDAPGNILTFTNPIYNASNHKKVGHDEGFCTRLDVKNGIWECLWTTFLKGGQITVQGPYYDKRNSVLSITGGTRAYRSARGQMSLLARDGGAQYDFIFHLS